MASPSNAVMAKATTMKRATIPFTVTTSAAVATIVASIDGEFAGNAEIFVASAAGAAQVPSRFGNGGLATSALDPSAVPLALSADTGPTSLGFVVLDGPSEKQPSNIPLAGTGKNPTYGTPAPQGDAKQIYSAVAIITDGNNTSVQSGIAAPASVTDVSITPNGNLNIRVTFPKFQLTSIVPAAVALTQKVAGQTIKGKLHLEWF